MPEKPATTAEGKYEFESVPQDQIEVHWQHPRTELESPLLLVWPHPVVDEWAAIVENGVATVVCHEWLYETPVETETDDEDTETETKTETEIQKRAEEWGRDEEIPAYVAEALLEYEGEYGPVHTVTNPHSYSLEDDGDTDPEAKRDDEQTALTDGSGRTATATDDSDSDPEIAEVFVDGTDLIPHPVKGMVPIYDGHPPDTHLPAWRCQNPDCSETSPTILEFWTADRNRRRLILEREEYDYGTDEWDAYNEGVHHYRDEIDRLYSSLPANLSAWVSDEVLSRSGRFFEPYPDERESLEEVSDE